MTEPYTITPSENGREVLLVIRQDQEMRAWNIARALQGRWAVGLRGFHMTPTRAGKWKVLFAGGVDATRVRVHDQRVWVFAWFGRHLTLAQAIEVSAPLPPRPSLPDMEVID